MRDIFSMLLLYIAVYPIAVYESTHMAADSHEKMK